MIGRERCKDGSYGCVYRSCRGGPEIDLVLVVVAVTRGCGWGAGGGGGGGKVGGVRRIIVGGVRKGVIIKGYQFTSMAIIKFNKSK